MNIRTINVIIRREYLNRVKKKSFLVTTFLVPVLMAALCLLPTFILMNAKEQAKCIAVVDKSGIVMPTLRNTETISYVDMSGSVVEELKKTFGEGCFDAVLSISELDPESKTVSFESFSKKPLGVDMTDKVNRDVNDAIEAYRIDTYGIEGLGNIINDVHSSSRMTSYTMDDKGGEALTESGVYMAISMILGMIVYMFIAVFCGSVLSSVVEEKASRVVEVLVSSVKATELMFGKIIGVALVALTQFFLWIVLTLAIVGVVGGIAGRNLLSGSSDPAEMMAGMGIHPGQMGINLPSAAVFPSESVDTATSYPASAGNNGQMDVIISTVKSLPLVKILVSFIIFFVFGFLLYASLFAAVGSAAENEADTQSLQMPLTIPLLLGFFIAFYAYKAPDSSLVFWGSMIPFTSPIVMLARIPYGVPGWELVLSVVLLIAAFIACAWISAKIYKVGVLMFGKKNNFKDLWKWLKMK